MNLTFVVTIWAVLGIVTLALAIYRSAFAAHREEDIVHLGPGEEREILNKSRWLTGWTPSTAGGKF